MGKKRKTAGHRHGLQMITLCISTTMVLILLGIVVFSVLMARNLSAYVKENLTVTVMLSDTMTVNKTNKLCRSLYKRPYTRHIDYISKKQAQKEQAEAMGSDPSEFLGFNPFSATFEIQLKSDYANCDSLKWISSELRKIPDVTDVAYQEDLMDKVNDNLNKLNIILLVLAVLLTCVSFSLINNTVRLSIYSRRFAIHTMKLVGASWGFIRRPFIRNAVGVGVVAAFLACVVLGAGIYVLVGYEPNMLMVVTWEELAVTGASVFAFGIVITLLCSYFSVNRFLKMKAGDLYKI
ncbi:cell division protein FtsX [Xylanibacter muris]|uniref:Cell division protein FtsX n=1 Tax=Xylanibacter muris TaxID=2736290 RepID=A0ABX2ALC9_9BACT|nr:permease-like cell division protein FtsX [Xylanibacter muris]NPD91869.1 cell division protein FtsX [Xylanibacter muris]